MGKLDDEVLRCANRVVKMSRDRGQEVLDYTDTSIGVVEEMLAEAATHASRMSDEALRRLSEDVGCYILEVARRNHGGEYRWSAKRNEPALFVGNAYFAITLFCWNKVRERLSGDASHDILAFYMRYVTGLRDAKPGDAAVFV